MLEAIFSLYGFDPANLEEDFMGTIDSLIGMFTMGYLLLGCTFSFFTIFATAAFGRIKYDVIGSIFGENYNEDRVGMFSRCWMLPGLRSFRMHIILNSFRDQMVVTYKGLTEQVDKLVGMTDSISSELRNFDEIHTILKKSFDGKRQIIHGGMMALDITLNNYLSVTQHGATILRSMALSELGKHAHRVDELLEQMRDTIVKLKLDKADGANLERLKETYREKHQMLMDEWKEIKIWEGGDIQFK